jgi:hypothetical protein
MQNSRQCSRISIRPIVRRLIEWIGGAVSRTAGTGLAGGLLFIVFGMTPAELVAYLYRSPPEWMMSGWTRLLLVLVGLALTIGSLRFNVWSQRQRVIDSLAEDISWAIHELVNRHTRLTAAERATYPEDLRRAYEAWCARVSAKLQNRAFFTRADQLHFDRLGFVHAVGMTNDASADHTLSMLRLKFARLRDVIVWIQQRLR